MLIVEATNDRGHKNCNGKKVSPEDSKAKKGFDIKFNG